MSQQRNSGNNSFASDYIEVAARIVEFRTKHPDGCLQPHDPAKPYRVETIGDQTFIVYTAVAYRSPDDTRPGIGVAWEPFPGRTNFTRGSELMNAETSAWGRAIVATLAADTKKGIATAEEVRNRQAEREERETNRSTGRTEADAAWENAPKRPAAQANPADEGTKLLQDIEKAGTALGFSQEELGRDFGERYKAYILKASHDDLRAYLKYLQGNAPATDDQLKRVHTTLTNWGCADRDRRLAVLSGLVGRRLETSKDLTGADVETLRREFRELEKMPPADRDQQLASLAAIHGEKAGVAA